MQNPSVCVRGRQQTAHLCMYDDPAPTAPAVVGSVLCLLGGSVLEPAAVGGLPISSSRCHLQHDGRWRFEHSQTMFWCDIPYLLLGRLRS